MPTYAYTCTACDHSLEVKQSFTDDALTDCPVCSGRLRKVFSNVGVVFKGSGFYRTDSRADAKGSDAKGSDAKGADAKGSEKTGSDAKGSEGGGSGKDSGSGQKAAPAAASSGTSSSSGGSSPAKAASSAS